MRERLCPGENPEPIVLDELPVEPLALEGVRGTAGDLLPCSSPAVLAGEGVKACQSVVLPGKLESKIWPASTRVAVDPSYTSPPEPHPWGVVG